MFVEVFQPFQTRLIVCPTIIRRFDNPIVREASFGVPVCKVVGALYNEEWRDTPTFAIDRNNCCRPFSIAWSNCLTLATSIGTHHNHSGADLTHHKTGLVEVVEIAIHHTIFRLHILYQSKPRAN